MLRVDGVETSNAFVLLDGEGEFNLMVGDMDAHKLITPSHVSLVFSTMFPKKCDLYSLGLLLRHAFIYHFFLFLDMSCYSFVNEQYTTFVEIKEEKGRIAQPSLKSSCPRVCASSLFV